LISYWNSPTKHNKQLESNNLIAKLLERVIFVHLYRIESLFRRNIKN
jgi:hypothetical protein